MQFLNGARQAYRAAGFEVQTIRIVTQPFPQYTAGMSRPAALQFLRQFDALAARSGFTPNIGPAMLADGDDPANVELLATVLAQTRLNASLVMAGDDGIHWNAIRQAARLVEEVSQRSPHGGGNLNFAATAMLKPYGPSIRVPIIWEAATPSPSDWREPASSRRCSPGTTTI